MNDRRLPMEIVADAARIRPIDLPALARDLGLYVRYEALPADVSGRIEKPSEDIYVVTINSRHSANRQRFTLAHEIAHYVLHGDLIGDGIVDDDLYSSHSRSLSAQLESQANHFAARMLMPRFLVREDVERGIDTPEALARLYLVSPRFAEVRLRELGLVPSTPPRRPAEELT